MRAIVLLLFLIYYSEGHITCDNPISNISLTMVPRTAFSKTRIKRAPQNLRISMYYDSSFTSLSNQNDIITLVINPAIQFWQDAVLVKNPLMFPLLIDRTCPKGFYIAKNGTNDVKVCSEYCSSNSLCYTTPIPSQYLKACYTGNNIKYTVSESEGSGAANTDLLLMVTQISTGCTSSTLAYASNCELEHGHDRPVLGVLNICPGMINTDTGVSQAIAVLKHEIAHSLGIAVNLYAFYRDENGNPRTPRDTNGYPNLGLKLIGRAKVYQYSDSTIVDIVKTYGYRTGTISSTISFLVTSTIKTEIRNHFNCQSLEGMMLENYGGSSGSFSHFEKLYLQTEIMTATISSSPKVSRLTLAVLQDTGWYDVNFDKAEYFDFGKNLGCDFVTQSCYDYMKNKEASSSSILPYCKTITANIPGCTNTKTNVEYCNLFNDIKKFAATVPAQFKYFPDQDAVSIDAYSDYCPLMITACKTSSQYRNNLEYQFFTVLFIFSCYSS